MSHRVYLVAMVCLLLLHLSGCTKLGIDIDINESELHQKQRYGQKQQQQQEQQHGLLRRQLAGESSFTLRNVQVGRWVQFSALGGWVACLSRTSEWMDGLVVLNCNAMSQPILGWMEFACMRKSVRAVLTPQTSLSSKFNIRSAQEHTQRPMLYFVGSLTNSLQFQFQFQFKFHRIPSNCNCNFNFILYRPSRCM